MPTKPVNVPNRDSKLIEKDFTATMLMWAWMQFVNDQLQRGFTGTITTAAITGGGATGTMTFENGVLVSQVPAT